MMYHPFRILKATEQGGCNSNDNDDRRLPHGVFDQKCPDNSGNDERRACLPGMIQQRIEVE